MKFSNYTEFLCKFEVEHDDFEILFWQLDFAYIAWIAWLARRARVLTWFGLDSVCSERNSWTFQMILKFCRRENFTRDLPGKLWSWAWFFWRPLQEGNFEIFLATPQLDPNRKPIWFCNCKLRYTVWDIWESQLVHIQFSVSLKHLKVIPPSFLPHDK